MLNKNIFSNLYSSLVGLVIVALLAPAVYPLSVLAETSNEETVLSAEIVTGDATAGTTIENDINTNIIDTKNDGEELPDSSSTLPTPETATTTISQNPENDAASSTSKLPMTPNETNITAATNTATTTNLATSTAETGGNTTEAGNFLTETGDAVSYIDVVNVVNTNIINSSGLIDFIRGVLGYDNFDMRDTFYDIFKSFQTAQSTNSCLENICDYNSLMVDLVNRANIYNDISVIANTGDNSSFDGSGIIRTGDAYASANIVNLANTNITDSNYLLLNFSNFSDMAGSLVLPNSDFFASLFGHTGNSIGSGNFNFSNNAAVSNDIEVLADTGNNAIDDGSGTITTGNSLATSHTENIINQNFLGTDSFSLLIRVHGSWSGEIFGLPEGMLWENTMDGVRLYYAGDSGGASTSGKTMANIANDATIANNVQVFALTGNNQISGSDDASIETGTAYADSTVLNMANTNIIGSNWVNLIFNIYGNWSGNIAFGQPDLWLGLEAETKDNLQPNTEVTYKYTIFNRGDTTARNVILENKYPAKSINFINSPEDNSQSDGHSLWSIGDIGTGETKELIVKTKIDATFGKDKRLPLPITATVYGDQPDANDTDNEDSLLLYVGKNQKTTYTNNNEENNRNNAFPAKFFIEKSADKTFAKGGDTINYTVKLTSKGGQLFDSVLFDVLEDEEGNILSEQSWNLDTIENGEDITISYSIILPENTANGIYTNTAQLFGNHGSRQPKYRTVYESAVAKHQLAVGNLAAFPNLNANILSCSPYLKTYLKQDKDNDLSEVVKLQQFLYHYVTDEIEISGVFDDATRIAVAEFQQQYAADILTPWGMTQSSGYVYYTTQKKINEIMCDHKVEFPLTPDQEKEMDYFKQNIHKINVDDMLFSGDINANDLAAADIENESATIIADDYISYPTIKLLKEVSKPHYSRFDNWLLLFKNTHTAFRY